MRGLGMIAILAIGALLRFQALGTEARFHVDEALFATFARNAAVHGDWLFSGALDKPPLSLYFSALSMHFTGVFVNTNGVLDLTIKGGEFSARLPNVYAGLLLIAITYALASRLCDHRTGICAAGFLAVSPMFTAYSATAFTDLLMILGMIAALWAALTDRPAWSGLALACSFWAKQQGLLILPLVLWALWSVPSTRTRWSRFARFTLPLMIGIALLIGWDGLRPEDSLFALASVNNNPDRISVQIDELWPRLQTWIGVIAAFFGWGGLWIVFARGQKLLPMAIYLIGYLIVHWVFAFNTYDRYLLPLIPLAAILIGSGLARGPRYLLPLIMALIMITTPPYFPDDQRAQDDAILHLAAYLNAKPLGAIVYDPWLGWEMGYYFGAWSDKRRVYYPDPHIQAADALLNPDPAPRYLIAPRDRDLTVWVDALRRRGFNVRFAWHHRRYQVYQIIPPWVDVSSAGVVWPAQAYRVDVIWSLPYFRRDPHR